MITELEKLIICSLINGNSGITEITKEIYGDDNLKTDYERVKYHLKKLEKMELITKNGSGYKLHDAVTVGNATVELNTGKIIEVLDVGKTMFVRGTEDDEDAIAIVFLESKEEKT